MFLADALVKAFSGKGLVPDVISQSPAFLLAVALGAASTVMLATVIGFPISTTHALTGALVGAGYVAAGPALNIKVLGSAFFLPLLISPVVSVLLAAPIYRIANRLRRQLGVEKEACVCVGPRQFVPVRQLTYNEDTRTYLRPVDADRRGLSPAGLDTGGLSVTIGTAGDCVQKYNGHVAGFTAQAGVDAVHFASGIAVSYARGLNDTPKIVGLLLVINALDIRVSMLAIALVMALGGLINSRKVAETMSKKISRMNDGQALTANLVTAFMVIGASRLGMPVSTTHVSVGAISGVGLVNGTANTGVITSILLSWLLTLPIAAAIAATIFLIHTLVA